jgi:ABC-type metal ion transport system, periplasmic component/surface antigen
MNKLFFLILAALASCFFGCSNSKHSFKVAATPMPHAEMLEFIRPELKAKGIDMEIVIIDDYNIPNRTLDGHEVDANFFQHLPFMEEQIKQFGYKIESLAKIELEPMGVYSKKIQNLSKLPEKAKIAIPNDPTNEARALALLEAQGLLQMTVPQNLQATVVDIAKNPKNLQFVEVDAAMLPRTLEDVDAAVINTNYALAAKLSPLKDALALEGKDSPYANIIAIRTGDEKRPEIIELKAAMTSEKMKEFILKQYQGAVIPAF